MIAKNPFDVSGKTFLVTGASSGIGRATARVLAEVGAKVILCGRSEVELEATRSQMERQSEHIIAKFDLTDTDGIPAWVDGICKQNAICLDGIVHAAGTLNRTPLRVLSKAKVDEVMLVNVYAALALVRAASNKGIMAAEGGAIVLLSSAAALKGSAGMVAYASSKGALISMVRSAAVELAPKKIRVNCIAPAYVRTPMWEQTSSALPDGGTAVIAQQFLGLIEPEEVATAVVYLLSNAARTITGSTLKMDSGLCC
jgi:3-oxoacyl-[acyl-carrier protein] reductase